MAVQALYRKWRPRTFDEVVGQEHIVRTLRNALTSGRIHHAYLFAGPRGTGKTTTARLLAKAVNCLAPENQHPCNECAICQAVNERRLLDLIEIDAASNTGVDDVRELRAARARSARGRRRSLVGYGESAGRWGVGGRSWNGSRGPGAGYRRGGLLRVLCAGVKRGGMASVGQGVVSSARGMRI